MTMTMERDAKAGTDSTDAKPQKWTRGDAGPIQTGKVDKALSRFRQATSGYIEITGVQGKPETEYRSHLIVMFGGPGMCADGRKAYAEIGERFGWTITKANYVDIIAALEEAAKGVKLPEDDKRITQAEETERVAARVLREVGEDTSKRKADAMWAQLAAKRPPKAAALIVAEYEIDDCDSMSDYYATKTTRRVAIGWRTGKREDFKQLRGVAAGFAETSHLGPDADESIEHRETHSMGKGNYLKATNRYATGWTVRSAQLPGEGSAPYWACDLEDAIPDAPATTAEPDAGTARGDAVLVGNDYTIEKHYHTKRAADFYIVVLAHRVGRAEYDALLSLCKRAGGWYSRAWQGTPGGFAFMQEGDAAAWAAAQFPGESDPPDGPGGAPAPTAEPDAGTVYQRLKAAGVELDNRETDLYAKCGPEADKIVEAYEYRSSCKRFVSQTDGAQWWDIPFAHDPTWAAKSAKKSTPKPDPHAGRMAEKLRGFADSFDASAEHGERDRQNNTPKRQREAASARFEASNDRHAARACRALADGWEAGTLPEHLRQVTTKKDIRDYMAKKRDHGRETYYTVCPTDIYNRDTAPARALQAYADATGTSGADIARAAELTLRDERERVLIAGIPGFHPTPDAIADEMAQWAMIPEGGSVLDPSAGRGDLLRAAKEYGAGRLIGVEINHQLGEILKADGYTTIQGDFLEIEPEAFHAQHGDIHAVLMNPPFEKRQDAAHVRHAYEFLKSGGWLVALVSPGLMFGQDHKATEFRAWLDEVGGVHLRDIPAGSFANAGAGAAMLLIQR